MARLVVDINAVLSTSELIDALWEEAPPDGASRSFKTYVARLRSALEDCEPGAGSAIVTHAGGYRLELDPTSVDAARFELLVQRARAELALGDHHTYPEATLTRIRRLGDEYPAEALLTTSKDIMKLDGRLDLPLAELPIEARPESAFWTWLDGRVSEIS